MAKPTRGGLGRGLTSLIGGSDERQPDDISKPTRDTLRYNEREDVVYDINEKTTDVNETADINEEATPETKVVDRNVSRETSEKQESVSDQYLSKNSDKSNVLIYNDDDNTKKNEIPAAPQPPKSKEEIKTAENETVSKTIEKETSKLEDNSRSSRKQEQETPVKTTNNESPTKKDDETQVIEVDIDLVQPNPEQPRTNFDESELNDLANSIKRNGLIQPILVRELDDGTYQIVAGERRWQASKRAGMQKIHVNVRNIDDSKALEFALIENIQRADLNPIEEAYGYKRMMERNQMTQADIAQAVSKARSTIANTLRLLELPEEAQQLLFEEKITAGHARAILSANTREDRLKITHKLLDKKMTVRETEALATLLNNGGAKKKTAVPQPAVYKSVARTLKDALDATVKVKTSNGKNRIEIEFKDEADLERIFDLINPE